MTLQSWNVRHETASVALANPKLQHLIIAFPTITLALHIVMLHELAKLL
jgi:hypothetical protein